MKRKFLLVIFAQLFFMGASFAQTWSGPGASNTTQEIYRSGKVGVGNFTSGAVPVTDVEIHSASPTLRLGGFSTSTPFYPTSTIQFGSYGSGTTFTSGFTMDYSIYPNCGSGRFMMSNGTTNITFNSNRIGYGATPWTCGSCSTIGTHVFGQDIGAPSILVGNSYCAPTPAPSIPSGYIFSVNGKSEFKDHVIIGKLADFTNGIPAGYKLYVKDGIITEKLKVSLANTADWSDYVFAKNYKLRSLEEVESFIKENSHLPEVPSAQDVAANGVNVVEMDATLLKKIEELTLYMIEMKKEVEVLKKENAVLKSKISQD